MPIVKSKMIYLGFLSFLMISIIQCSNRKEEEAFQNEDDVLESNQMLGGFKKVDGVTTFTPCGDSAIVIVPATGVNLKMLESAYDNMLEEPNDVLYLKVEGTVSNDTLHVEKFYDFQTNSNCQ